MSRSQRLWRIRLRRVALARLLRRAEAEKAMQHLDGLLSEWCV